jgi:DNA-binding beta-propeller fold protein YncE
MTATAAVVTLAGRTYAVERGWGRLPSDIEPAMISQVAVDSQGRVHAIRRADPPVVLFAPDGSFAGAYGSGRIFDSHGVFIDRRDRVFLADRDAHEIVVFDADGGELFQLGTRHQPHWRAPFNHPTDAAVADDGEIYVSDGYGNARVHRFAADGGYLGGWGEVGQGPGQFMTPHAIWIDRDNRVLVVDRENDRVQVFTRDGDWLEEWRGLCRPMDIFADSAGTVFVTDQVPSLHAFAPDGSRIGRCRPSLNGAHGIFGDAADNLYLVEIQPNCITKLTPLALTPSAEQRS